MFIQELIEKLDDIVNTNTIISNFGRFYIVADIAYDAILQIIRDIPVLDFAIKSKNPAGFYWFYYDYVRADMKNKIEYKKKVKEWYFKNKSKLKWYKDTIFIRLQNTVNLILINIQRVDIFF